jgi:hypothetical protein
MVQENNVDIVVVEVNAGLSPSLSTSTMLKATNHTDVERNVTETSPTPTIPESVSMLKDGGVLFSIENGNVNNN